MSDPAAPPAAPPVADIPIRKCSFCGKTPFGETTIVNGADGRRYACCRKCVTGEHDKLRKVEQARGAPSNGKGRDARKTPDGPGVRRGSASR